MAMDTPGVVELHEYVGYEGRVRLGNLLVGVRVIDVRANFGRVDYKVTPLNGTGEIWVGQGRFVAEQQPTQPPGETDEQNTVEDA